MAEKILNTRILMKIDTLENWSSSSLKLKEGELAFATVAASAGTGLSEPVVMVKIGTSEEKTFSELPWAFHAKASDVLAACKTEAGLKAFVNGVIAEAGIASDEAMQELAGRVTTAENKITSLEGELNTAETGLKARMTTAEGAIDALEVLVGDEAVATQIANKIAELKLGETYEVKGEAAKVQTALNEYKTSNDAAVQKNASDISGEIARAKAAEEANANAISAIKDGTTIDSFKDVEEALAGKDAAGAAAQALVDAKAYADGLAGNYDAKGSAAQALVDAKAYADGLAGNYDAAGSAAQALVDAKAYTDEEIAEWVGDKTVGVQINTAIADLKLSENYDAKGAAAQALVDAKKYADEEDAKIESRVDALEVDTHTHANKVELDKIVVGDKAKWDAMEQNAKDYADGLNTAMDGRVAELEAMFGDGEGTVEAQIEAAVSVETALREAADTALDNRVKAIEDDHLVEADKTELQGAIDALELLVGDGNVAERIAAAVKEEADRAKGIEGDLESRLATVEGDYLKAADKTELEGKIKSNADAIELLTNGVDTETVDGVNDLIQYVKDHGTEVTGIKADIKANSDAIDAIEADYLKAADKKDLQDQITANDGEIEALQTAVGTKAAQSDLEALTGRVSTVEGKVSTLEGEMDDAQAAIEALEGLVGTDKNVATQISDAINELKDGQLTTMQGEIDAVEDRVEALEAIDHEHANKTVLDGITSEQVTAWDAAVQTVTAGTGLTATKTGTDVAIGFDDSVTFIFDCGGAAE